MANLSPEQLAALRLMAQQGGQSEFYGDGRNYMLNNGSGWTPGTAGLSGQDGFQASAPTEIRGYDWAPGQYSDNFELNGTQYDKFNAAGENTGQGTWEGLKQNSAMDTMLPFLMAAAPFALTAMGAGAGAGYGALGATEPVASIGAAGGMTQAELAALGAGGGGLGTMAPLATIEGPMSSSLVADSLTTMGGGATSLLGGAAKYLGPAATLLGAAAGGQGQKTSTTSERKTDPRVDPYLFGANGQPGLLGMTYDQLSRDQSPERLAQRDQMRGVGMGLLSQPIAGNGFNRFFKG